MKKVKLTGQIAKKSISMQRTALMFICFFCMNWISFAQVDLDSGLIAYLPLNGNGTDQSGNNNHAVNSPGTTQTFIGADRFLNFPGAMRFIGENGQSKMTFGTPLLSNRNEYTISFWFSLSSGPSSGGMSIFGQDNLLEVGYYLSPNRIVVYHPVSGSIAINLSSPIYNTWRNVIITGNGTELKVYLNGTPVSTQTGNYTLGTNSNTTNLGGHVVNQTSSEWMKGHIDDLRIYSRVVTADEITALSNQNQPGIVINSVSATTFCAGDEVALSFSAVGDIQSDNVYSLQLSQPDGTFLNPIVLDTLASSALSGNFNAEIPTGVYSGTNYKLRVVSSNMSAVSNETSALTITSILGNFSDNSTYYFIGNVNGKNYYRSTGSSGGGTANITSNSNGGNLATVYDAAVNQLMYFNARDSRIYIGLNDLVQEGTFVWRDGTTPGYTNWASGQPDNSGNEDYVEIRGDNGQWNDLTNTESKPHFMELLPAVNNQTVCIGEPINLQAKPITGASYLWTGPNGFSSTMQNPSIGNSSIATAGVYTVTYSLNGCSVSDSAVITPNTLSPNNIGQSSTVLGSLSNGLVLHYGMNGNGNDASGNALNATLVGGVTPRTDRFGIPNAALQFNGTNGYLDVPDGVYFDGSDFTVSAWVRKVSNNSWSRLFDFGNGAQNNNVLVGISSLTTGRPAAQVYTGTVGGPTITSPTVTLTNNQWQLLTYVYSNGSAELYIDGNLVAQGAQSTPNNVVRTVNYIGRSNWASDGYSNAGFDDFRIYDRKLSLAEIQSLLMEQPNALAVAVVPGASCNGTAQIALVNSQPGVTYQLINSTTQASEGAAQLGTGDTLIFTTGVLSGATDFHFSAQASSGCSITLTQTITVAPHILPSAPTALNDSICNEGVLTISVSGGTNYLWYTDPTGGTPLSGITGNSYTTGLIDETANYYVSAVDNFGCESPRTLVSAVVINPLNPPVDIISGLILHYPFDGNYNDLSGNGYNATTSGSVSFVNDKDNNPSSAVNSTASTTPGSNFINAGNPAKIQQLTDQVTISMWVRHTQTWFNGMPLLNKWDGTGMFIGLGATGTNNKVRWRINSSAFVQSNTDVPMQEWHHIVCTYNGSQLKIYQNGVLTGTATTSGNIPNTSGVNLLIGKQANYTQGPLQDECTYRGDMDEIKIYNRALGVNEIQTLYNNESVAFATSPLCDGEGNLALTTFAFPGATYSWTGPHGFTSNQQNPTVITAADSATYAGIYSLEVTAQGCTSPAQTVAVTIYQIPTDPLVVNDTVCGSGNAVLTASGAGTGAQYNWYTVPVGGTPISGQTSATFSISGVTSTQTRYVSIVRNGCESNRVAVQAVFIASANTNLTVSGTTVCHNTGAATVTIQNSENGVSYQAFYNSNPVSSIVAGNGSNLVLTINTTSLSIGNNTVSIQASQSGCGNITLNNTATLTINALPPVDAGTDQSICQGSPVTLSGSGAVSYSWNNGVTDGVAFVPSTTGTYTVTGTDANGCQNTDMVTVTVDTLPVPLITAASATIFCQGSSVTLNAGGGTSYLWSTNETTASISVNQTGTYHVTAYNGACSAVSSDISVTVNAAPAVSANADQTAVCNGQTVTLTGSGAVSFSWNNGVTDGVAFVPSATGTYTVTGTDANNCTATDAITITVHSLPNAGFTSEFTSFCPGTITMDLTADVSSYTTYDWFENGNPLQLNGAPVQAISNPGTYELSVTDVFGCTNTSSLIIGSGTAPVVTISSPDNSFCAGSSETITANLVSGGMYTWYLNGNPLTTATLEDIDLSATQAGDYTVEVTDGCTGTSNTITLTETALPLVSISSAATSMCPGDSILLTGTVSSGATYQWLNDSNPVPGAHTNSYYATAAGNYQLQLTDGCTGTSNAIGIAVNALPSAAGAINGTTILCAGETDSYTVGTAANATAYNWTIIPSGAATISQGQGTTSIILDPTNTNFTIHVTPQNACGNGSESMLNVAVTTTGTCLGEVMFAANTTLVCAGSTVVFTNYTDPNFYVGLTPQWNFGAGASPATATGNGPHTVTYSSQGLKTVTLNYVDAFGNSFANETKANYIHVSGSVSTSSISGNAVVACNSNNEVYSVVNTSGSNYQWSVPSGAFIVSGQGTNTISVNFNGNFGTISVTETNSGGCVGAAVNLSVSCNTTGIQEVVSDDFKFYPNPATNAFKIEFSNSGQAELLLFDLNGKLVKQQTIQSSDTIAIDGFERGVYIGKVLFDNNQNTVFRIVKH